MKIKYVYLSSKLGTATPNVFCYFIETEVTNYTNLTSTKQQWKADSWHSTALYTAVNYGFNKQVINKSFLIYCGTTNTDIVFVTILIFWKRRLKLALKMELAGEFCIKGKLFESKHCVYEYSGSTYTLYNQKWLGNTHGYWLSIVSTHFRYF